MTDDHTIDVPSHRPSLILPRLYLCDIHTAQDADAAKHFGITHILSVLDFVPSFPSGMDTIKKMHVRLSDSFREEIKPHFEATINFIREALEANSENNVLVHCVMGISRSATVVCAYLIAEHGMTATEAINFVRERRGMVCPNVGFRQQLDEYSRKLRETTKAGGAQIKAPKNIGDSKPYVAVPSQEKEVDPVAS